MATIQTPVQQLIDWVVQELKLTENQKEPFILKAAELLAEEKQHIVDAWKRGNQLGWAMQTDWDSDAVRYYHETFQPQNAIPTYQEKALALARRYNPHPVFKRDDIELLTQAAFQGEAYLESFDLSPDEMDNLLSGLNIAREY